MGPAQIPLLGATSLLPGRHIVVANYGGDSTYHAARFLVVHRVLEPVKASTATVLTAEPNPVNAGSAPVLTATVTTQTGIPSGQVDFVEEV